MVERARLNHSPAYTHTEVQRLFFTNNITLDSSLPACIVFTCGRLCLACDILRRPGQTAFKNSMRQSERSLRVDVPILDGVRSLAFHLTFVKSFHPCCLPNVKRGQTSAHECASCKHQVDQAHLQAAFRYSLPVLKIYSVRHMLYRFSVLTVNIGTQSM